MAVKRPLVMTAGFVEQLQSGDTLDDGSATTQKVNGNAGTLVIGQVVYSSAANTVDLANAGALATKDPIGFVADTTIAISATGGIQVEHTLTATIAEWDVVTGNFGTPLGLVPGMQYFLSPIMAGGITTGAPTTVGEYVVRVGKALSATELFIDIHPAILL